MPVKVYRIEQNRSELSRPEQSRAEVNRTEEESKIIMVQALEQRYEHESTAEEWSKVRYP